MSEKVICKKIIKETGLELRKVQLLPENLLYVTVYHDACALAGAGQYSLAIDICDSLQEHLRMLPSVACCDVLHTGEVNCEEVNIATLNPGKLITPEAVVPEQQKEKITNVLEKSS